MTRHTLQCEIEQLSEGYPDLFLEPHIVSCVAVLRFRCARTPPHSDKSTRDRERLSLSLSTAPSTTTAAFR